MDCNIRQALAAWVQDMRDGKMADYHDQAQPDVNETASPEGLDSQAAPTISGTHPFEGLSKEPIKKIYEGIEIPTSLFHYTSAEGLLGILGTHTMRFSDAAYLNDGSESIYGLRMFSQAVDLVVADATEQEKDGAAQLKKGVEALMDAFQPIIFCFSRRNNLLNQWRDYGRDIIAYCIEFDVPKLEDWSQRNFPVLVSRVVYDPTLQANLLRELLQSILEKAREINPGRAITEEEGHHLIWSAAVEVIQLISRFKHPSFEAEEEWRAICYRNDLEDRVERKYRSSSLGVVPYYDWHQTGKAKQLPVKSVTVGPSPYGAVSDLALKQFLKDKGYDAETYYSTIPIRR
jgi:hypothetical protein